VFTSDLVFTAKITDFSFSLQRPSFDPGSVQTMRDLRWTRKSWERFYFLLRVSSVEIIPRVLKELPPTTGVKKSW
jgi:hypothetical protein